MMARRTKAETQVEAVRVSTLAELRAGLASYRQTLAEHPEAEAWLGPLASTYEDAIRVFEAA